LIKISGINPGENYHAHHVFILEEAIYFKNAGINVNQFGVWWEKSAHLANRVPYSQAWKSFISKNQNPAQGEIFQELFRLKELFGF